MRSFAPSQRIYGVESEPEAAGETTEAQERLEEVVVAVVEGNIDFAAGRLVANAVLEKPVAVLAWLCEICVGAKRKELLNRKRTVLRAFLAADESRKLEKPRRHDRRGGGVALLAGRAEIPVGNTVSRHVRMVDRKVGDLLVKAR